MDIRDAETGESVRSFHGHDVDVNDVAFSHDGSMLATTGDDGAAKVWDPHDRRGAAGPSRANRTATVWGPSFSPDGSPARGDLARRGAGEGHSTSPPGRRCSEIPSPGAHFATSFSPDGERLAMVADELPRAAVVRCQLRRGVVHPPRVTDRDCAMSRGAPTASWIATSSNDATARIWDAETGRLRFTLYGHAGGRPRHRLELRLHAPGHRKLRRDREGVARSPKTAQPGAALALRAGHEERPARGGLLARRRPSS